MPRPPRLHVAGGFYHVTLRGNHRQPIFFTPDDRGMLDEMLAEALERFKAKTHAYCWMTNHIHLIVQVSEIPLGRLMHRLATRFARSVQSRVPTTGHLFERRYDAQLVDADAYLMQLVRYVHLNPVRAAIVSEPAAYRWSSHRSYLGLRQENWLTTSFVFEMFHAERSRAAASYRKFMAEPAISAPSPHPGDPRVLGNDEFLRKAGVSAWQPCPAMTLDDLIARCCCILGVTPDALASRSQARHLVHARACIAHLATEQRVAPLAAVARRFRRDESSVRQSVVGYLMRAPDTLALQIEDP